MPPQAQGDNTKLVRVEGQLVRVPVDATTDEIDQIATGRPPISPQAQKPGAMQRQPGGPIFTMNDIRAKVNDKLLEQGRYDEFNRFKEEDPNYQNYMKESGSLAGQTAGGMAMAPVFGAAKALPWLSRLLARSATAGTGIGLGSLAGGDSPKEALRAGEYAAAAEPAFAALGPVAKGIKRGLVGPAPNPPITASDVVGAIPGMSRAGKLLGRLIQEPKEAVPGVAREAAGGTAATAGPAGGATDTALGSQAGPSQGPKSASELSSVVQRVRAGNAPGTAAGSSIYTPESLASEQGMSTAALGKGGFNLTIPPEQQRIMQMVAEGKVPMGSPKPPAPMTGFSGLQPPTGTSPSFGAPEDMMEAARRGASGVNPNPARQVDPKVTQAMFDLVDRLRKAKKL